MDVSLSLNMTILPSLCTSCTQATSTHFFRRVLCVILTKSDLAEAKSDLGRIQYFLGSFTTYYVPYFAKATKDRRVQDDLGRSIWVYYDE